jgi:riboflavin biosynthesis pyrimidine reductase
VTAPGDGEVTVVTDETMGEKDPLLARLLAAATAGASPAGPANNRKPVRIVLDPDDRPIAKSNLCGQARGFNLHAATKVAANDTQGRLAPMRACCSTHHGTLIAHQARHVLRAGYQRIPRRCLI